MGYFSLDDGNGWDWDMHGIPGIKALVTGVYWRMHGCKLSVLLL